jgi:[protein-PII] uridylyltransferase
MSRVRANVVAAKQRLAEGYEQLKQRHRQGASGLDICRAYSDLRDEVLLDLFHAAINDLGVAARGLTTEIALLAHGGYGRREVSPFSDVDLMLVHLPRARGPVSSLAERLLRDVFDAGLSLGQSVCTPFQACTLANEDPMVCTSLAEARLLVGSPEVFARFLHHFGRHVRRRSAVLMGAIDRSRCEERIRYGETVFLLEPNVKRSRGALRDVHLLRWIGHVRYGMTEPAALCELGVLSGEDCRAVAAANEFLLRLRNELHFHAGKPGDVLNRAEQVRIAELQGYPQSTGMLPVEQFMRDYFRYTDQVSHVANQFVAKARSNDWMTRFVTAAFGHWVQDDLRAGPAGIMATRRGLERLHGSLPAIMRLVDLANLYDKPVAPATWDVVRQEASKLPDTLDGESCRIFLSLLSHPGRLGPLLRDLHETHLLERFIPAYIHARGLLQFNQYHKYTVDEHCLRAVECAAEQALDQGPLGRVYRSISRKNILHLALLIHDLGKGYPEDHVPVGVRIAAETAARLRLPPYETEVLKFLVENHQMMEQTAFRRDTSDEQLLVRFAVDVGSPELLAMLFSLTAADLSAVGPGVWDGWKAEILGELYRRAMQYLAGDTTTSTLDQQFEQRRDAVIAWLGPQKDDPWFERQLYALPSTYLDSTPPKQIAEDLRLLDGMGPLEVKAQGENLPESGTLHFTVATREDIVPGIFHRLTGALTSQGLQILSAQINTLADGLVIDRFWVYDPDYTGQSPPDRIAQVNRSLTESLRQPASKPPSFRRTWQVGQPQPSPLPPARTRVKVDNNSSDRYTILDIFAHDRGGLLYTITRKLFELGLSVSRAKIATHLDQVVDVFYVTNAQGRKIEAEGEIGEIRRQIREAIEALEKEE